METKTKNKDSVITQINQGDDGVNVAGDIYIYIIEGVFKNTEGNNASDIKLVVTQRELDLRIGSIIFMMISTSCIFAFVYPTWWVDSSLYAYFAGSSWTIAVMCGFFSVLILKNRKAVERVLYKNIIAAESRRRHRELV